MWLFFFTKSLSVLDFFFFPSQKLIHMTKCPEYRLPPPASRLATWSNSIPSKVDHIFGNNWEDFQQLHGSTFGELDEKAFKTKEKISSSVRPPLSPLPAAKRHGYLFRHENSCPYGRFIYNKAYNSETCRQQGILCVDFWGYKRDKLIFNVRPGTWREDIPETSHDLLISGRLIKSARWGTSV